MENIQTIVRRYEGIFMPKEKRVNKKTKNSEVGNQQIEEIEEIVNETVNKTVNKWIIRIGSVMFGVAIGAVVSGLVYLNGQFSSINSNIIAINKDIEKINDDISDLHTEISDMGNNVSTMHDYLYGSDGVKAQLKDINDVLKIEPMSTTIKAVYIKPDDEKVIPTSITAKTCIGVDTNGKKHIAKDLVEQKILLTYEDENKEVVFLGQFNENYNWDGYCVTNTYNLDGTLYGICESNFDNGKRLDYKSFYSSDSMEWNYADRKCHENSNTGINILCTNIPKKTKNFTNTNVRVYDILYVDDYLKSIEPKVLKYYSGNTSDELYNDETGNAYLVIYDDDNTIKTLYVGNFVDGNLEDSTGNAWDIAYSEKGGYYVHNTGKFKEGRAVNPSSTPISIKEINKIIKDYDFKCELKWKK